MADVMEERLRTYIQEVENKMKCQLDDRKKLENAIPLSEEQLRKMDSALKRTTAFMKKLKNIGCVQLASILQDMEKVNLSKFVEEMAMTIAEAKIKYSEVQAVVTVCVNLSCYYAEFASLLLLEFRKLLPSKRNDKIQNPSKLRVDIRLLGELCLHGVFGKEGVQLLGSAISFLTLTDRTEHVNIPILLPFCKAMNVDLLGLHPYSMEQIALTANIKLPETSVISADHKKTFAQLLLDYRSSLVDHIKQDLLEMNQLLLSIKRQTRTRGDASAEDRNHLEETRARYEKVLTSGTQLSEYLGVEMEAMEEEQSEDEEEEVSALALSRALQEGTITVWPDEDTRQFYETRMELRQIVPAILFQESEQRTLDLVEGKIEDVDLSGLDTIAEEVEDEGDDHSEGVDDEETKIDLNEMDPSVAVNRIEAPKISGQDLKLMMIAFMEQLPWLINRDLIDKAALDFVTNLNTRNNRKKLCQMMLEQYRNRLDLLPFYGRLVATLEPVMPDLALELSHSLLQQFRAAVQNKKKQRVDLKIRCARFISELVKFGIIPKGEGLSCLRMVLFDFRGHNIDMCCAMVDAMGQFLYRSTDSHGKMKILLGVMMKKRDRISDPRQQMLIDNAFYTCIPPAVEEKPKSASDPFQDFIRYLISNLSRYRLEITIRCLRKLDWSNPVCANYAVECLSNPSLPRYNNVPYLASLIAALSSCHDWIGIRVLDATLEDIRIALELNSPSLNQSTVLSVIFLGQLYNYSVCDSPIIFKTLYQLITFGAFDPLLDDWNNLTRIGLVCELLLVCGEYFNAGSTKKKLDCFLAYFFRYLLAKEEAFKARDILFPKDVRFRVEEMSDYVRKGSKIPKSFDEAQKLVDEIQQQYRKMVDAALEGKAAQQIEEVMDEEDEPRRINCTAEVGSNKESNNSKEIVVSIHDENESVRVHTNRILLPEDELFVRQLEQIIAETMQSRANAVGVPVSEIVVPTSARQKFHRTVAFDESARNTNSGDVSNAGTETRMAILTRGKGNKTVLKAIAMDAPSFLAETWNAQREKERKELSAHKHITLSMSERMMMDDDESLSE
ncbi:MIF4G domain family protein [Acanthocheilonema viteae]